MKEISKLKSFCYSFECYSLILILNCFTGLHYFRSLQSSSGHFYRVPLYNISNGGLLEVLAKSPISLSSHKDETELAKGNSIGISNEAKLLQENRRSKELSLHISKCFEKEASEAIQMNEHCIKMENGERGGGGGGIGFGIEAEGLSLDELASELLRETHGCESYFLQRDCL